MSVSISIDPTACKGCGYFACVCKIRAEHSRTCRYLIAALCPVGIACDHGFDVCPICDPCTCKKAVA